MSIFSAGKRALAGAILSLAACAPVMAQESIVVYTGIHEEAFTNALREEFKRQTGITVEMLVIPANGTLIARVQTEKDRPRADVIVDTTVDFIQKLTAEGLIEPYKAKAETPDFIQKGYADADGYRHGWFAITPMIFWNKERYDADPALKGVPYPATWDDLLNPAYQDKLMVPNPQTTAMGSVLLMTQVFRLGEEKAWEYVRALHKNVAQYTASASLPVALVERGEGIIGVVWSSSVLDATIGRKQPLGLAVPPDNAVSVWVAGIVKGGPNTEGARKFIDFLQSDFVQDAAAKLGYRLPVSPDIAPLEGVPTLASIKAVDYDLDWAAENVDRIRKQWAQETNQ